VRRQHRLRFDPLDPIFAHLEPLSEVPEEKVDQHAAHRAGAAVAAEGGGDALDGDDGRGTYGDLLAGAAREFLVRFERTDERGRVGEQAQVVQDLWDAVVREHR